MSDLNKHLLDLIIEKANYYINDLKSYEESSSGYIKAKEEIIHLVNESNNLPLSNDFLIKIFTEILSESSSLVKPVKIAFLGPAGTFSSIAVKNIFGSSIESYPQRTIHDVFSELEKGSADFGVIPVENSTEGSVTFTLDELIETNLNIVAEKNIRISYTFSSMESSLENIDKIFSHPQPEGQCKEWIRKNLPHAEIYHVDSTAKAAEEAANCKRSAAISSEAAVDLYDLNILASRIEDYRNNFTRFIAIGRDENKITGKDKTSIVCTIKDQPSALLKILQPMSNAGINMTKIESRPDKKKMWEYNFFIDFIGHKDDRVIQEALKEIEKETQFLKILGSYSVEH